MAFTRRGTQPREKGSIFFSLHKLVGAEAEKMTVITVTLYSNPLSSVAIAECPSYLGVYLLLSVFLREIVGVCVQGIVSVNPAVGEVWAARS